MSAVPPTQRLKKCRFPKPLTVFSSFAWASDSSQGVSRSETNIFGISSLILKVRGLKMYFKLFWQKRFQVSKPMFQKVAEFGPAHKKYFFKNLLLELNIACFRYRIFRIFRKNRTCVLLFRNLRFDLGSKVLFVYLLLGEKCSKMTYFRIACGFWLYKRYFILQFFV